MVNINEQIEIHDTLNPKLWNSDMTLKEDVRNKLLEIVDYFEEYSETPLEIVDVHFVGSNASYNYTKYSDIDLHIVCNFEMVNIPTEILNSLYNMQKASFNSTYDISIKGVNTEIYVEDIKAGTMSNGIYSVLQDKWVKKPVKLDSIPKIEFGDELNKWISHIKDVLKSNNLESVKSTVNGLYMIRKNSIAIDGEYGKGNQLFKEIRNLGYLDELKHQIDVLTSKELSLENCVTSWEACDLIVD